MREILFRGKDSETGVWHEGQYIHLHKTTYCFSGSKKRDEENEIHQIVFERMTDWNLPNRHLRADVLPETVGQYTGLTDKNGKKIFEGDIVKVSYRCRGESQTEYREVLYNEEECCYYPMRWNESCEWCDYSTEITEIEVIGNIHDNPELLKGE